MKAALASWLLRRSWLGNATMADFARSSPSSPAGDCDCDEAGEDLDSLAAFAQYLIHGV